MIVATYFSFSECKAVLHHRNWNCPFIYPPIFYPSRFLLILFADQIFSWSVGSLGLTAPLNSPEKPLSFTLWTSKPSYLSIFVPTEPLHFLIRSLSSDLFAALLLCLHVSVLISPVVLLFSHFSLLACFYSMNKSMCCRHLGMKDLLKLISLSVCSQTFHVAFFFHSLCLPWGFTAALFIFLLTCHLIICCATVQ